MHRRRDAAPAEINVSITLDPEWNEQERAVYKTAEVEFASACQRRVDWPQLQSESLHVLETVALSFGRQNAVYDFTLPEGLALIEQVSHRYRRSLKRNIPLSDQISVARMIWLWRNRDRIGTAWQYGFGAFRVARAASNPVNALIREAEGLTQSTAFRDLKKGFVRSAQVILLEEVARAAVDLYSGRLAIDSTEVSAVQTRERNDDLRNTAEPDAPVRVVFVGQSGVGKSTLINALGDTPLAETDQGGATDTSHVYEAEFNDHDWRLVDTPGLDRADDATLDALKRADIVVWVAALNRPSRHADVQLRETMDAYFAENPARRPPETILAGTFGNRLGDKETLALEHVATDLRITDSVIAGTDIASLRNALARHHDAGLMVQRNRARLSANSGISRSVKQAKRGIKAAARIVRDHAYDSDKKR